jgi:hypothetical protein
MKARENFFFQHYHAFASLRQKSGGAAAAGAATDYQRVINVLFHFNKFDDALDDGKLGNRPIGVFIRLVSNFFVEDNSCFQTRFESVLGYPHALPHIGRGIEFKSSFVHQRFVAFLNFVVSPTSVGFMARAAALNLCGCRARQKPPSRMASFSRSILSAVGFFLKGLALIGSGGFIEHEN